MERTSVVSARVSGNLTARAQKEKAFQLRIEGMQIAIATNKVSPANLALSAQKELDKFRQNRATMKTRNIKPVSDYKELGKIYTEDLKDLDMKAMENDAERKAENFARRAISPLTDSQEKVISTYFATQAQKAFNVRTQVENLLKEVGILKGKPNPDKQIDTKDGHLEPAKVTKEDKEKVAASV